MAGAVERHAGRTRNLSPAFTTGGALGRALAPTVGALSGRAPGAAALDKRGARTHTPSALLAAVTKAAPQFRGRAQQDAHELLRCLLDGVRCEEDGKAGGADKGRKKAAGLLPPPSASASYAERVFGGQLASCLACACGDASTSVEPFMDLSLPVPTAGGGGGDAAASTQPPHKKAAKKSATALTAKQAKRAAKAAKQKELAHADAAAADEAAPPGLAACACEPSRASAWSPAPGAARRRPPPPRRPASRAERRRRSTPRRPRCARRRGRTWL